MSIAQLLIGTDDDHRADQTKTERWLIAHLTGHGGTAETTGIFAAAKQAGVAERTLRRVRQRLGIEKIVTGFPARTSWRINPSLSLDTTPDAEWRQPVMSTNNDATPIKYQDGVIVYTSVAVAVRDNDGTWKRYNVLESTSERKTAGAALTALGTYLASTPFLTAWDAGLQYLPTKRADGDDQW